MFTIDASKILPFIILNTVETENGPFASCKLRLFNVYFLLKMNLASRVCIYVFCFVKRVKIAGNQVSKHMVMT